MRIPLLFLVVLWGLSLPFARGATSLATDGSWVSFQWYGIGTNDFTALDGPYTFTVPDGFLAELWVTDIADTGDVFKVTDGSAVLGTTSEPISSPFKSNNPDITFADSHWSSGVFSLGSGAHSVDVETIELSGNAFGGGFLRVSLVEAEDPILPSISWSWPGVALTYGDLLTQEILNASAGGIDGTFVYTPSLGAMLPAGVNQVVSVTFTPADTARYLPVTTSILVTVNPAPLTIRANDASRAAGAPNPAFSVTYTGFVNGETESVLDVPVSVSSSATVSSVPGQYPITASGASDSNYAITFAPGTLTIAGRLIPSLTWEPTVTSIVYGTPLSEAILNAKPDGSVPGSLVYEPGLGEVLHAGEEQVLRVTFIPTDGVTYETVHREVMLEVTPAALTIRANDLSRPAGVANPPLTAAYEGFVNGDGPNVLDVSPVLATEATPFSESGSYAITVGSAADQNYAITFEPGVLTIADKLVPEVSWVIASPTLIYGTALGPNQLNAQTLGGVPGQFVYSPAGGQILAAGANQVLSARFVPDEPWRYEEVVSTAMVTVVPKPLLIRADDKQRSAGTANPTFTASYSGFVNGETITVLVTQPTFSTAAEVSSAAGDYPILLSGASSPNYTITHESGVLTVTEKAVLVLEWSVERPTIVYGEALGASQLNARVDGVAGAFYYTPALGTVLGAGADQSLSVRFVPEDQTRYAEVTATTSVSVIPAPLTVRVDDVERAAGVSNPAFTISYEGLVNGDTGIEVAPMVSTSASLTSSPGPYALQAGGGSDPNYAISYLPGTLTILEKERPQVVWNPPSAPLIYGQALSAAHLNATTSAGIPGTFEYVPSLGTILHAGVNQVVEVHFLPEESARYAAVSATAAFTVNRAPLTIRALDKTRLEGEVNPVLTLSYEGFVNGDTTASLSALPTVSTTAAVDSAPGSYPISVGGAASEDYAISYEAGQLVVEPAGEAGLPVLELLEWSPGWVAFAWEAPVGTYVLWESEDLIVWERSLRPVTIEGDRHSVSISLAALGAGEIDHRFFRLVWSR